MSSQVICGPAAPAVANSADKLLQCTGCQRTLPVRAPRASEGHTNWECEHCHSARSGLFVPKPGTNLAERVRLARSLFDTAKAEPIPPGLRQLVEQFLIRRREKQEHHDRRRNQRVPCDLDAVVVELDDQWLPSSGPMHAVVIDLAAHGLGMMTATRIAAQKLAIQIQCPSGLVQLVGRNAWSNFIGEEFQNTGVEFIVRLGRTDLQTG